MKSTETFSQILENTLKKQGLTLDSPLKKAPATGVEPLNLASLWGKMYLKPSSALEKETSFPRAYRKLKASTPKAAAPKVSPAPRPQGTPHALKPNEKTSFDFFKTQEAALLVDFTATELKISYRRLALRLHPDRKDGSAALFIELKKHYETLKRISSLKS